MSNIRSRFASCFVAFVDLLGFEQKVLRNTSNEEVLSILIDSLKICSSFPSGGKKVSNDGVSNRKISVQSRFFSDSVAFFMKDSVNDLSHLFLILRYLQDRLWEKNICMRGAITLGEMYWPKSTEKGITIGNGLIEAYKLEHDIAIYPRVIISDELYEYIKQKRIISGPFANTDLLIDYILRDEAGIYYIDFLNRHVVRRRGETLNASNGGFSIEWNESENTTYDAIVNSIGNMIDCEIHGANNKVKVKYEWLRSYVENSMNNNE